jgi:SEC-C motif
MAKIGRNDPCPCGSGKKYKKCHGNPSITPPPLASFDDALATVHDELLGLEEQGFGEIGAGLPQLLNDFRSYDRIAAMSAVAGLASVAENHIRVAQLDCLLHLIAIHCNGDDPVTVTALDRWLSEFLARSPLRRRVDPAEDVAVGNVMTQSGNYRIFTGTESNPDYYLQDVLDAIKSGPAVLNTLRKECDSVLKISELLAMRKGYDRLTGEPQSEAAPVWIPVTNEALWALSQQSVLDASDLARLGIDRDQIMPFSINIEEFSTRASRVKVGAIRRQPFITIGDLVLVAHPTSLAMALIWHIFSCVKSAGMLHGLEIALKKIQAKRTLNQARRGVPAADALLSVLSTERGSLDRYVSQTAFRFDRDKYLHLLFLHDEGEEIALAGPASTWHPPFGGVFADFVEDSSRRLLAEGRCRGGLTLVVIGGVWRSCAIAVPRQLSAQCGIQVWSSADLDRLMLNEDRWKLLLWKLSMQVRALEDMGIRLEADSDANLYSMWAHHDYRLARHDDEKRHFGYVGYGPDFIFDMRLENRLGTDDHATYRPDRGAWERVAKIHSRSYFKEDVRSKTYAAVRPAQNGVLQGAVETAARAWWVDCSTAVSDPARSHLIYELWESALNWVGKIAGSMDHFIPELGNENVVFDLDFSEIVTHKDWSAAGFKVLVIPAFMPMQIIGRVVSIRVPVGFLPMAYSPKNDAERLLVRTFVEAALALAAVKDDGSRSAKIIDSLALSDHDRFMHLIPARDVRDYLGALDHERPELLHDDELAFDAIHIGQEANLKVPSKHDSVESVDAALHQLVNAFWRRIEARLREVDRADFVVALLTNNERLLREHDRWRRTSRAVLSLHEDRSNILKASQAVQEKRDRTQIIGRVLIEMALCTSPLAGGRLASQSDIDYLGSQLLLLIATAAHSDAVRHGCAEPSMQVLELGDFTFGDNFMGVMQPYIASHFERTHMASVQNYDDLFTARPDQPKAQEEVFGKEFVDSFADEFGISPGRLAELGVVLGNTAIAQGALVVAENMNSFVARLSQDGFASTEVKAVQRSFMLRPRERWDNVTKPFRPKDFAPWRFRRRLSLMARPFVDLGDGRIVYAPGFVEDSFRHVVMESFSGAFETEYFDTKRMRQYAGAVNARRGLDFNKAVAGVFSAEGWHVRVEVSMKELEAPEDQAKGDVDVLAWNGNVVCACECKELLFARNVSEVADQLKRFRGSPGDDLDKHLRRARFIQSNPHKLLRITNLERPRVVPLLVTSKTVPMQFSKTVTAQVVSADQITPEFLTCLLRANS